ncbi:MAG: hypothetical protein QXL73_06480 [Thermoplasmata archaeon]
MIKFKEPWYFRWFLFFIVSVIILLISKNILMMDTLLLIIISFILFIIDSIYRDVLLFYVGVITLIGAIIASSMGDNPFNFFVLLIYLIIIFITLDFIVLSWEKEISRNSLFEILKISSISIILSFFFILVFSNIVIIERNIITFTIMITIILFSLYFLIESIER